jgi:hypothetical protein
MVLGYQPKRKSLGGKNIELLDMSEMKLRQKLESIKMPMFIFDVNSLELKNLLEFITNDPKSESLTLPRNHDKLHEVQLEILRRLHNFVAASLTLIDHTRYFYKDLYSDSNQFEDYQGRIRDEFEVDPLSQFIKGLRQYFQHYSTPKVVIELSFPQNADGVESLSIRVLLFTKDLLEFSNWNPAARKFLKNPQINLLEVTDLYRAKIKDFYNWFIDRLNEIHQDDLSKVKLKHNEFIQAFIEAKIDSRLQKKSLRASFEDEIFSEAITSKEFESLASFDAPPNIKADYATQLLSRHFPVSESLSQKIIKLYKQEQ